jgi:hypothetical protein
MRVADSYSISLSVTPKMKIIAIMTFVKNGDSPECESSEMNGIHTNSLNSNNIDYDNDYSNMSQSLREVCLGLMAQPCVVAPMRGKPLPSCTVPHYFARPPPFSKPPSTLNSLMFLPLLNVSHHIIIINLFNSLTKLLA